MTALIGGHYGGWCVVIGEGVIIRDAIIKEGTIIGVVIGCNV